MLTSRTSFKKLYGSSADFFSSFFPCSRCSAAVRKANDPPFPDVAIVLETLLDEPDFLPAAFAFPFDLLFFWKPLSRSRSSSSNSAASSSSSPETMERRDEMEERREDDLLDLADGVSTSESSGTTKSSSSEEALERDLSSR